MTHGSRPGSPLRTQSFRVIHSARPIHRRCLRTGERAEINESRTSGRRSVTTGAGLTAGMNGSPLTVPTVRGHITGTCDPRSLRLLFFSVLYRNDKLWLK